MKKTNITITMLCLAACFAAADTKITWLADVTADRAETVTGVQSNVIAAAAIHTNRTDNPHGVTAAQIGAITAESDPVANAALVVHANRTDNPHGVTAPQIGALTAEQDLAALAADRFIPLDAGKNVISTDAGANANTIQSILIGDRAGNVVTGSTIIAIGRDAAREIVPLAGIVPETELSTIAIGENAAEQAGGIWSFAYNIAIGNSAFKEGAGQSSIAIGSDAGRTAAAQQMIAIGSDAGRTAAAEHMIAIGYQAGEQAGLTNSVVIGANAGRRASGQNILVIDSSGNDDSDYPARAMIYGKDNNLALGRIDSNNNVLRGNWLFNNHQILTNETDTAALAALAAYAAYWPRNATASSWFNFVTNSGAITITGYNIAGGTDVVIPDYINGWPVTAIGPNAFKESGVTSIGGAGNVVTVGNNAFYYCTSLVSVSLPQAQTVGLGAFRGCTSLVSVSLPQAQTVGDSAFASCYTLASVSLPQAQAVEAYAFYYCTLLTSVSLPQAQMVETYAFYSCTSLASVYFDSNAPAIGSGIFAGINPNQVTNYVTNPQATGWGATFGGMPVVRPTLYADAIYQAGELVATTQYVAQAIAAIPEPDLSDRPTFAQIAASNALPYTAWTGTVTPQNGTATVAYAHGNMPVLVVPNGGGTTRVTVATGTYAATSGVSRVSLSIWAGTNAIELVTNDVNYVFAPDIPTNGWGTILFRRVSNGKWKGVGL